MRRGKKFIFSDKKKISSLPKAPGVYGFKKGRVFLYIGKAANIRERVKNHFSQPGFKESFFISEVKKIGYIKTDCEIGALILEADLIKKYQPRFNVDWKDDKNYFYAAATEEDYPRIFITHQASVNAKLKISIKNLKLRADFIGPFVDGGALKQTLKVLRKVFPYRTCRILPKKPCLWHQLERCLAPCQIKIRNSKQKSKIIQMRKECRENVKAVANILRGKRARLLKTLKKEMQKASKEQEFEKAAKIRNQLFSLEKILRHSKIFGWRDREQSAAIKKRPLFYCGGWRKVQRQLQKAVKSKKTISRIEGYDVSNIQGKQACGSMVVFKDGIPASKDYRKFKIKFIKKPNDTAMLKEVLSRRFQHSEWKLPDLILIDGGRAQLNVALKIKPRISEIKNIKIISLAKRKNRLYIENKKEPVLLENLAQEIANLILCVRDEAHRFAIAYHKKLRSKAAGN